MTYSFPQIFIAGYLLIIFFVGFFTPKDNTEKGFLFANRSVTLPALVMSLVSTWYGGILEVGRYSYENGIVTFVMFGLFYYIAAAVYAVFIAPKISSSKIGSIPELFEQSFDHISAIIAAIVIIFIASPAPYIKMLASILSYIYGIGINNAILIGTFISIVYTIRGGFRSVLRTDIIQFSMMFIGFAAILIYLYINYGGYSFLERELPAIKLSVPGNLSWGYLFSWGFIALVTFIDPNFYQRSFSGASKKEAKRAILISILFWFLFDFISVATGLYAAAIIGNVEHSPFLDLASIALPPLLQGIFIVSMLSIIMSTIDSFVFVSGLTIGKNLIANVATAGNSVLYTKIGIALSGLISVILATFFNNAVDIWYVTGSFGVSGLLIPMLCCLYRKSVYRPSVLISIPLVITGAWFLYGPPVIDPMYPGVLSSIICYLILRR
jgi:SSS family solute:Na+ symporter